MNIVQGMTGEAVGQLQQQLLEAGESIDAAELNTQAFGPSTLAAVLDFQASHLGPDGHALGRDGIVGPATAAALRDPHAITIGFCAPGWAPGAFPEQVVQVCSAAVGEIGAVEVPLGSNRGPRVDQYEGPDWLGSPWCALFASWCWAKAAAGSPFGVLASAYKLNEWGAQHGRLLAATDKAQPGDLALFLRAGGHGHVEIVVSTEVDGAPLSLVGGNVSNSVRGTVRPRSSFTAVLRPMP